jgi:hypothetical protein
LKIEDNLFLILDPRSSILDLRFRDSDNAAGQASTGVACGLGFQVIGLGVNNQAVTDDCAVAVQFRHRINVFEISDSALIGFDISHIAGVALGGVGSSVGRAGRIEMAARGRAVLRAAIAEFMDMEAMLARSKAFNARRDFDAGASLGEGHHAADIVTFGRNEHSGGSLDFLRWRMLSRRPKTYP